MKEKKVCVLHWREKMLNNNFFCIENYKKFMEFSREVSLLNTCHTKMSTFSATVSGKCVSSRRNKAGRIPDGRLEHYRWNITKTSRRPRAEVHFRGGEGQRSIRSLNIQNFLHEWMPQIRLIQIRSQKLDQGTEQMHVLRCSLKMSPFCPHPLIYLRSF